jgi:hypothetical protein
LTRGDEGMIWLQRRGRNGIGPAIAELGVLRLVRDIAHDAEVVQRVGQVRMERAETSFLQKSSLAQQLFSGGIITRRRGLFRRIDHGSKFARVWHGEDASKQPPTRTRS